MNRLACLLAAFFASVPSMLPAADLPARPHITGVSHIALYVHDLDKSRTFYTNFLGFGEPYTLNDTNGGVHLTFIKINDRQTIELFPEKATNTDRLNHIAIETDDAAAMRDYLAAHDIKVPDHVPKGRIGNANFNITDPDGHQVEIVQYLPDSWSVREKGHFMPATRISARIRHVGIIVTNLDVSLKFYEGILGFRETWRGSRNTNQLSWVNLKVPDGDDYIEFMLYPEAPAVDKRGGAHHLSLEVADINLARNELSARTNSASYARPMQIQTGINRKRQLNLFDPDGTRVELMEANTVDGLPTPSSTAPFPGNPPVVK
jgi:lactoylglutathione lyase